MRKAPKKFIKFNSCVGDEYRVLSNFCQVPGGIKWRGRRYPLSASTFTRCRSRPTRAAGTCSSAEGALGSLESRGFWQWASRTRTLRKKLKFWGPIASSHRPCMVGIVAKMAVNHPGRVDGLQLKPKPENDFTDEELIDIFKPILKAKWKCFSRLSRRVDVGAKGHAARVFEAR